MDNNFLALLIISAFFNSVISNSISNMNMLDEHTEPKCNGPTLCFLEPGKVYTITFTLRVDKAFDSREMKWMGVVGKPRRMFVFWKRYGNDQTLFKDYSLCPSKGRDLMLGKFPCPHYHITQGRYSVKVSNVKMPNATVTEKLYLSDEHDKAGTLGVEIKPSKRRFLNKFHHH